MDADTMSRFKKIVGMLGSDHPGERSAAALKATDLLREHHLDWSSVGLGERVEYRSNGPAARVAASLNELVEKQSAELARKQAQIESLGQAIDRWERKHREVWEQFIEASRRAEELEAEAKVLRKAIDDKATRSIVDTLVDAVVAKLNGKLRRKRKKAEP